MKKEPNHKDHYPNQGHKFKISKINLKIKLEIINYHRIKMLKSQINFNIFQNIILIPQKSLKIIILLLIRQIQPPFPKEKISKIFQSRQKENIPNQL